MTEIDKFKFTSVKKVCSKYNKTYKDIKKDLLY